MKKWLNRLIYIGVAVLIATTFFSVFRSIGGALARPAH